MEGGSRASSSTLATAPARPSAQPLAAAAPARGRASCSSTRLSLAVLGDKVEGGLVDGDVIRVAAPSPRVHGADVAIGRPNGRAALPGGHIEVGSDGGASGRAHWDRHSRLV